MYRYIEMGLGSDSFENKICMKNATRLMGVTSYLDELKSEIKIECIN